MPAERILYPYLFTRSSLMVNRILGAFVGTKIQRSFEIKNFPYKVDIQVCKVETKACFIDFFESHSPPK